MATKSILPNSAPHILTPIENWRGTLCVKWIEGADSHALFLDKSILAMHHNGFSCHNLAERLVSVWEGKKPAQYAIEQFEYILSCGGVGASIDTIRAIAETQA